MLKLFAPSTGARLFVGIVAETSRDVSCLCMQVSISLHPNNHAEICGRAFGYSAGNVGSARHEQPNFQTPNKV